MGTGAGWGQEETWRAGAGSRSRKAGSQAGRAGPPWEPGRYRSRAGAGGRELLPGRADATPSSLPHPPPPSTTIFTKRSAHEHIILCNVMDARIAQVA